MYLVKKTKSKFEESYYKLTKSINSVNNLDISIPNDQGPYKVVYLDGINFKTWTTLIARSDEHVIGYDFVKSENSSTWTKFLSRFVAPSYVVCDEQKGLLKAIKTLWPCTKVQRCLFHVWMNVRQKLTLHPETDAGIKLLKIGKNY